MEELIIINYHVALAVVRSLEAGLSLINDDNQVFREGCEVLSKAYVSLHEQRSKGSIGRNEREMENLFWNTQRKSEVIDCIVGSACVVLMRWISQVRKVAIFDLMLLETEFPHKPKSKRQRERQQQRHLNSVMCDYGLHVPGKQVSYALAIWQIGNVFKHSNDDDLHPRTSDMAGQLGFRSMTLSVLESEEALRQRALDQVGYTLDSDSIERMALQLGCNASAGLMPLYDHVCSWKVAIANKLRSEQAALRVR